MKFISLWHIGFYNSISLLTLPHRISFLFLITFDPALVYYVDHPDAGINYATT